MATKLRLLTMVIGLVALGVTAGWLLGEGMTVLSAPDALSTLDLPPRLVSADVFDLTEGCGEASIPNPLCAPGSGGSAVLRGSDHDEASSRWPGWPEPEWGLLTRGRLGGGRRGIDVQWAQEEFQVGRGGAVAGLEADKVAVMRALPVLREAVALYPDGLLESVGIRRFVFVDELHVGGTPFGGVARRSTGSILLDPVRSLRHNEMLVHHEIMHFLDRASAKRPDRDWASLNVPGTRYGVLDSLRRGAGNLSTRHLGFLTLYSQRNAGEDKAEVFRWLMTYPDVVDGFVQRDPFLGSKVERLAERLYALDARLDQDWWAAVWAEESRRNIAYAGR
jgi:hypothetical protein